MLFYSVTQLALYLKNIYAITKITQWGIEKRLHVLHFYIEKELFTTKTKIMKNIRTATIIKELPKKLTAKKIIVYGSARLMATVIIITLLLNACQKESSSLVNQNQPRFASNENLEEHAEANRLPPIPYVSCGMKINVFTPVENSLKAYAFAYTINRVQKKFSIGTAGKMSFTSYDKFSFEFAGYLDTSKKVKSWRIRRTDGKYLTTGLTYKIKLTGSKAAQQTFLLASLGNGQYKILLPKLPVCNLAAIWYDIDLGYRISNFDYNDSHLDGKDTKVTMVLIPLPNQ